VHNPHSPFEFIECHVEDFILGPFLQCGKGSGHEIGVSENFKYPRLEPALSEEDSLVCSHVSHDLLE